VDVSRRAQATRGRYPNSLMVMHPAWSGERSRLSAEEIETIVVQSARLYFESRRSRVNGFIDRHFSLPASLALHTKALGWDVLRAPVNVALAVPYIGAKLTAGIAGRLGAKRVSRFLASRRILLETAVGRETEWLILTELLELPFRQGYRISRKDALAEMILASPRIQSVLTETLEAVGHRADHPMFRKQLEQMVATYTETRAAAAEITATLITMAAGAAALKQVTPGAMLLGPALASLIAYQAAVASFPLGTTLGGIWYGFFPVAASPGLIAGTTGSVMAAGAIVAAFSGIIADPLQRRLGLHRRRLLRLIDALERQFSGNGGTGFVVRDHYVARLFTLVELLSSAYRLAKP
jgi:hypothetical protein